MHFNHLTGFLLPALVSAQTFTSCDPTKKTCGSDVGLNQAKYNVDFTKGTSKDWKMTYGTAKYDRTNGLSFTINKITDAPTMQSEFYFFFGTVTAIAKASPGTGIVSCVILESDDLDEIDWEWLGGQPNQVQTNYFGKGNTTSYDRGSTETVQDAQNTWHNYTIQWTSAFTTWYIDGAPVRTLQYADAVGGANYPQTPMRVKLGTWSASTGGSQGTIEWAGGQTNFAQAPFTMHVKSLSITNSNPGSSYVYGDRTGSFKSIKVQKKLANLPENVGDDHSNSYVDVFIKAFMGVPDLF
ncbi:concanavalin A-like lectin/glucanase domain-containing protein [Stachybotrys elegans]|uniref:chitinase n=1 Tax=Stachybotrys elegans TaxID=80388 RepID=A0A8K0WQ92_9HYPO|nr:concanavalin A-like lectin/glucanase domain-containing protein [Stachybotrys elegans]